MTKLRRKRAPIIGFVGILMAFLVTPPAAQPTTDGIQSSATVSYYDIGGTTWQEVLSDLATKRPTIAGTDQRYEAVTAYEVTISYPTLDGHCSESFARQHSTAGVYVRVVEHLTFPQLLDWKRLSQIDQQCWSAYDRDIRDHEEGHLRITGAFAKILLSAIRASHFTSCSQYEKLATEQMKKLHEIQDEYDALTAHGLLQSRFHNDVELPRSYEVMPWCKP